MTAEQNPTAQADYLAAEYARHAAAAAPHLEAMERIKDNLRRLYGDHYGAHPAGNLMVKIGRNSQLDATKFQRTYPVEQFPHYYKPAIDRDAIPKNVIAGFMKPGKPKVEIK